MRTGKRSGDSAQQRFHRGTAFLLRHFTNSLRSIDGVQQPAGVKIVDAAIDYHQINFGRIRIGAQGVLDLIVDAGQTAIHFAILQR